MRRQMYSLRVDPRQLEQWEQAARRLNVTTTQLVRATMTEVSSWPELKTINLIDLEKGSTRSRGDGA